LTEIRYEPGRYRIRITGHAGAGEKGRDIVCAGVSALAFALLRQAGGEEAAVTVDPAAALIDVRCAPADEAAALRCRAMLDTVAGGLRLIAETWPDYVRFETISGKEEACV